MHRLIESTKPPTDEPTTTTTTTIEILYEGQTISGSFQGKVDERTVVLHFGDKYLQLEPNQQAHGGYRVYSDGYQAKGGRKFLTVEAHLVPKESETATTSSN